MPELECALCHCSVKQSDKACPSCEADLRRLGAVRRQLSPALSRRRKLGKAVGPPFGDVEKARLVADLASEQPGLSYVMQGLVSGLVAGAVFGVPFAIALWSLLSATGTPVVRQLSFACLGLVPWLISGTIMGVDMGRQEDFANGPSPWAVYPTAVIFGAAVMAFAVMWGFPYYAVYVVVPMVFLQGYVVGYLQRMFFGPSWDVG